MSVYVLSWLLSIGGGALFFGAGFVANGIRKSRQAQGAVLPPLEPVGAESGPTAPLAGSKQSADRAAERAERAELRRQIAAEQKSRASLETQLREARRAKEVMSLELAQAKDELATRGPAPEPRVRGGTPLKPSVPPSDVRASAEPSPPGPRQAGSPHPDGDALWQLSLLRQELDTERRRRLTAEELARACGTKARALQAELENARVHLAAVCQSQGSAERPSQTGTAAQGAGAEGPGTSGREDPMGAPAIQQRRHSGYSGGGFDGTTSDSNDGEGIDGATSGDTVTEQDVNGLVRGDTVTDQDVNGATIGQDDTDEEVDGSTATDAADDDGAQDGAARDSRDNVEPTVAARDSQDNVEPTVVAPMHFGSMNSGAGGGKNGEAGLPEELEAERDRRRIAEEQAAKEAAARAALEAKLSVAEARIDALRSEGSPSSDAQKGVGGVAGGQESLRSEGSPSSDAQKGVGGVAGGQESSSAPLLAECSELRVKLATATRESRAAAELRRTVQALESQLFALGHRPRVGEETPLSSPGREVVALAMGGPIAEIMSALVEGSRVTSAVLADRQGLVVGAVGDGEQHDGIAAWTGLAEAFATRTETLLPFAHIHRVMLIDGNDEVAFCRPFKLGEESLFLGTLSKDIPPPFETVELTVEGLRAALEGSM